ncbi:hypothetical protein [Vulcanisaeta sp. JCM 16159]|uniref:hypothetical protein n=1 Tax=Vulcanisaeta sp. JCM 16159 TaxID=1295371 RepID=UPI001FB4E7BB|nr:hypothetical protein [Vulcanisaeta sp. JCM 16159]
MIRLSILVLILLLMGIHVVMAESSAGNVTVNIFNVNGKPASSMHGVVYGILVNAYNEKGMGPVFMNNNSQLIFKGIQPGTYILYVYYYPNSTAFNYTEYWGNLTINVFPGKAITYNFTRNMPWIKNVYVNSTQLGNGSRAIITVSVVVYNPQSVSFNGVVTVYISSQESPLNAQVRNQSVTLNPGVNNVNFTYTLSQPGTYYAYVVLKVYVTQPLGQPRTTDQYDWTPIITVYLVSFTESGLPSGTLWWVSINGTRESSNTNTITLLLPNGTYQYEILPVNGYVANITNRSLSLNGLTVNEPMIIGVGFKSKRMPIISDVIIIVVSLIILVTVALVVLRFRSRNAFDDVATA